MKRLSPRVWLTLVLVGLVGQFAWTIENMYFNVYLYNTISTDPGYISAMVGFSNRQSFYAAFYRFVGKTPRQYRVEELEKRAIDTTPKKRGRKPKNRQEGNA